MSVGDLVTRRGAPPRPRQPMKRGPFRTRARDRAARAWDWAANLVAGNAVAATAILIDLVSLSLSISYVGGGPLPMALFAVSVPLLLGCGGHYRAHVSPSILDELPGFLGRSLVAGAVATAAALYLERPVHDGPMHAALLFIAGGVTGRLIAYPLLRRSRLTHPAGRPTIIVGSGLVAEEISRTLLTHAEYGLKPIGYVDDNPLMTGLTPVVPFLGQVDGLLRLVREHHVRGVIVAFSATREAALVGALRCCDRSECEIYVVPRFFELDGASPGSERLWSIPLIRLRRSAHRSPSWRVKRLFDVVAAGLALIVLSPLMAACAFAAYLEGGPGVIFRQERIGVNGRPFHMLKFRSLKPASDEESAHTWTIAHDPRIGPVGRWLRQLSLDELPQLWNILRGDMSLVGPRPERPVFVDEFSERFPGYVHRHRVPVGLTGWAQVNGLRGDTDIRDRATFDNFYIDNWSMWSDVKILLRTVGQVVSRKGA
jgi:exopolysaccharide biosynthesis polyprenyl glycosylphosphotransferase